MPYFRSYFPGAGAGEDAQPDLPLQQTESIALTAAAGRITAAPVISPIDVPPFANSAMDGYAVRLADLQANAPLPVAGKALLVLRSTATGQPVPAYVS